MFQDGVPYIIKTSVYSSLNVWLAMYFINLLHKENSKPTSDRALEGIGLWISKADGRGGSEAAGRAEVALTSFYPMLFHTVSRF